MTFLLAENEKYNLTSIKDKKEFLIKHICDSAAIFLFYRDLITEKTLICDIGSGAGFPALVIALASKAKVHAVEASQKKASFIRNAATMLGLKNIEVIVWRAEELNKAFDMRARYDIITARALGKSAKICELSSNMLSKSGKYIIYKTPNAVDVELEEVRIAHSGFEWGTSEAFSLPCDMGSRIFMTGSKK
jgi:16S rRNA (guanine527-N7)-methyltransferase